MKKILKSSLLLLISAIIICGFLFFSVQNKIIYANAADENVILGGMPIGIRAESPDFLVSDFINVVTPFGSYSPAQKAGLKKGDVILSVNGQKPINYYEFNKLIQQKEICDITIQRDKELKKISIQTVEDIRKKERKIGLMIKKDISGIGTMTYIMQNGEFGALGHPIGDEFGHVDLYQTGTIYDCIIYGYNKPEENQAGGLLGQIDINTPIGTFNSNTLSGIKGTMTEIPKNNITTLPIGNREAVLPGKAQIYTTIDGKNPSLYDIEIIKTEIQPTEKEKSMVIRVTDKKLLQTTGGILQGMSGSPIIQNEKLIGAVTHVLTSDATIGYGIFIDWMIN